MPYDKGFRVFNLKWVVSSTNTTGSTYENDNPTSGKILNSNGTFGYTDDKWGVKRCLEDFCHPLFDSEDNGEGWQLDTDLCPDNEAILLKPNVRVWVLFFKHTTGARLMLGLNYFGMISITTAPSVDPPVYTSSGNRFYDIGFLSKWTNYLYPSTDGAPQSGVPSVIGGGLFMSMIPPAKEGEEQDTFHPEISIRDLAFYPQTMTPVQYQKLCYGSYKFENYAHLSIGTSFIKQGTNDTAIEIANSYKLCRDYGAVLGRNIKLSLFVCEEVVGFIGRYKGIRIGGQICGRILSDCRQTNDNLSTAEYAELVYYGGTNGITSDFYLWNEGYSCYQINRCCNVTGTNWPNMYIGYQQNGYINTPLTYERIYAGYVYGNNSSNPISTNGQEKSKLRSDLFRFTSNPGNKTYGQTYNNNSWCFFGSTMYSSDKGEKLKVCEISSPIFIKWDGAFNGSEILA